MSDKIRAYWEQRAKEEVSTQTATTNDVYLRELEINTCVSTLRRLGLDKHGPLLDAGCGDGHSTLSIAKALPELELHGVDYAENMVAAAKASAQNTKHVSFSVGDITKLSDTQKTAHFAAAVTMRCIINLETPAMQEAALGQIAQCLQPGGYCLAFENFVEGQDELTRARAAVGLGEIPMRWHNRYVTEDEWTRWASPHFESIELINFASSYYFATRVVYSKMCQMKNAQPDYRHDIHKLAIDLVPIGNVSPVRLVVMKRRASTS